ncbi:MAG: Ig-like domain-containing protein [Planctomycetota bacterium]|nr:Ig-like domain-containing protein [Planctomycetota bacterium]
MQNRNTFVPALFALVLAFVMVVPGLGAEEKKDEDKGRPEWDELSDKIIPKILEASCDTGTIIRFVRKVSCKVNVKFTSVDFKEPLYGTIDYCWEDKDGNGVLEDKEIEIELSYSSGEGVERFLTDITGKLKKDLGITSFNMFRMHHVRSVKVDEGYKMQLKPRKKKEALEKFGYTEAYLTVSDDFRTTRLRSKTDDGCEAVTEFKYTKLGGKWYQSGHKRQVNEAGGGSTYEDKTIEYFTQNGQYVPQTIVCHLSVATLAGRTTIEQEWAFDDWDIELRKDPLPLVGAGIKEDAGLFEDQPKDGRKPGGKVDPDEELFREGTDKQTPPKQPEKKEPGADEKPAEGGVPRNETGELVAARQPAPKIVGSEPANGAGCVARDVGKIIVRFDQPMNREKFSICPAEIGEFPLVEEAVFSDAKTLVIKVGKLEAKKKYAFMLNSPTKKGFRSAGNIEVPLEPVIFEFTTGE